jgi:hypothetical protein
LPIALLEAMSYNLDVLVSDIPANKISCVDEADFFKCGSVEDLSIKLKNKIAEATFNREYDLSLYNWDYIAREVVSVYQNISHKSK